MDARGARVLQIRGERVTNFLGQWEAAFAMGFSRWDENTATYPIDIVEP